MRLLHLDSSIQGANSVSRMISAAVVEQLRIGEPKLDILYRDVAATPLPHLTFDVSASDQAKEALQQFLDAEIVVIGAALYNFTIPSQLKAWIDCILVAGKTFRYGENGSEGLVGNKRVIVALARGGIYRMGSPFASFEHAEMLLRSLLTFIGVSEPEFIIAEGLALGEEAREASIAAALDQATRIAPALVAA